ncbi:MAG: GNAT family N-acetyltransferase [Candidatus Velthaea sp.]
MNTERGAGSAVSITTLQIRDIPAAARLLARAFFADPILTHFLAAGRRRQMAFHAFFRAIVLDHIETRHVYGAWKDDRLVGVAVWAPPGRIQTSRARGWEVACNHLAVRLLYPRQAGAMYRGFAATGALHPTAIHWYLLFIGIEPTEQGNGLGRELLAPVLQLADQDGTLCYLETPYPATHSFYRRLRFELRPATRPFDGAPPLWSMIRRPTSD